MTDTTNNDVSGKVVNINDVSTKSLSLSVQDPNHSRDADEAYNFKYYIEDELIKSGFLTSSEMNTVFVHLAKSNIPDRKRSAFDEAQSEIAVTFRPVPVFSENQYLWDLHCTATSEDEFIKRYRKWREWLRNNYKTKGVDAKSTS